MIQGHPEPAVEVRTIGDVIERQVPALKQTIGECNADFEALREWRRAHANDNKPGSDE